MYTDLYYMSFVRRKPVFKGVQPGKTQTILHNYISWLSLWILDTIFIDVYYTI